MASVRLGEKPLTMSCPVAAALETWVITVVVPAAYQIYGQPVVELKSFGTYNCRTRNNRAGARLSEHAFANAIDISGFVLADGRTVSVLKDWRGGEADRTFLRTVHSGACGPFTTVLGPGSDGMHENHLHLDLAHHNAAGTYRYCKPKIDMPLPNQSTILMASAPASQGSLEPPPGTVAPWPRVLPQSSKRRTRRFRRRPCIPAADGGMTIEDLIGEHAAPPIPVSPQPANCPEGFVCIPAAPTAAVPPPLAGWEVGPQPYEPTVGSPLGYADD